MRVLLFGRYAEIAGWRERDLAAPVGDVAELIDLLAMDDPALGEQLRGRWTLVARNKEQVHGYTALAAADEVAFMPPMSGG